MLSLILGLILILRVSPSFIGGYFTLEESYSLQYIFDCTAFVLFSLYALKDMKRFYKYPIHVLLLVANLYFLVNYIYVDVGTKAKTYLEISNG